MARKVYEHGTRERYRGGCSCLACRRAEAEYRRHRRASKQSPAALVPADPPPPAGHDVTDGLRAELELLGDAADRHPGLAATALAMARILDDPEALTQHASAARRLMELMAVLGRAARPVRGKLSLVREMTDD